MTSKERNIGRLSLLRCAPVLLCLLATFLVVNCASAAETQYEMYRRGTTELNRGHSAEALQILTSYYETYLASETASKFDAYKAEMMLLIGDAYLGLKQYGKALSWYQRPLNELASDSKWQAEAKYRIAQCLQEQGLPCEAQLWAILTENPGEARVCAFGRLAVSKEYGRRGETAQAVSVLLPLLSDPIVDNDAELLEKLINRQLGMGDTAGATATIAKLSALAETRWSPDAKADLQIQIAYWRGNYKEVIRQADAAFTARVKRTYDAELTYLRAHSYDLSGQTDIALEAYAALVGRYGSRTDINNRQYVASALMRSGMLHEAKGLKDRAIADYQQVVADYSDLSFAATCAVQADRLRTEGQQ